MNLRNIFSFLRIMKMPGLFPIIKDWQALIRFHFLYYFEEEDRAELLHKVRSLLSPRGILAIAMNCHSQGTDVAAANLNIVTCSLKGLTPLPSREEIIALLKRCAFLRVETHRFMPASTFYGFVAHNCS